MVEFLKSDAGVASLVSTRVYVQELPDTPTLPAIVIRDAEGVRDTGYLPDNRVRDDAGGRPDSGYLAASHSRMDVLCYGDDDFDEAKEVWLAAYDALKHMPRNVESSVLLLSAVRADGPHGERDTEERTVSRGTFVVLASDIAAA